MYNGITLLYTWNTVNQLYFHQLLPPLPQYHLHFCLYLISVTLPVTTWLLSSLSVLMFYVTAFLTPFPLSLSPSLPLHTFQSHFCQSLFFYPAHSICLYTSLSPILFLYHHLLVSVATIQALFLGLCLLASCSHFSTSSSHIYFYLCICFKNLILFLSPHFRVSSSGLSGQFRSELVW